MRIARVGSVGVAAGLLVLGAAVPLCAAEDKRLSVRIDHAQIAHLPAGTATIVVGNPLIADATVQQAGIIVVTGKSYGSTNILVLDNQGRTLSDIGIDVTASDAGVVTVYRGTGRETYTCAPVCEAALRVGDRPEFFDQVAGEITKRTDMSKGQGGE